MSAVSPALGQPAEDIILKDGSVLSGYICRQRQGEDLIFMAERAELYISSEAVYTVENRDVNIDLLSDEWQEWCRKNPYAIKQTDAGRFITLSDITVNRNIDTLGMAVRLKDSQFAPVRRLTADDRCLHDVRILERGSRLKFADMSDGYYSIAQSSLQSIRRMPRKDVDLSGIVDIIETSDGRICEGEITGQIPGKSTQLATDDGVVEIIPNEKIVSQRRRALNPEQPLFEQCRFLEEVTARDGAVYKGLIIEQNYGSAKTAGFIRIQDSNGSVHNIELRNMVMIVKKPNPGFKPIEDIILADGEILVNREKAENVGVETLVVKRATPGNPASYTESVEAFAIEDGQKAVNCKFGNGRIVLETRKTASNDYRIIRLTPCRAKKKECWSFTYQEFFNGSMYVANTVSPNNTMRLEFDVKEPGMYVIYNNQTHMAVLCNVE